MTAVALLVVLTTLFLATAAWLALRLRAAERAFRARESGESDRLRTLVVNSPEGFWRADAEGKTLDINQAMADMLGIPASSVVGRPFGEFVPPESQAIALDAFLRGQAGEAVQFEATLRNAQNRELRVLVTTHPILDKQGRFLEGFGIIRDITERHRVESEHRHAISLLEAALESTADGLLVVDREGRIVRFNERFARMWGIPESVLAARNDDRALASVLSQLEEPELFLSKVRMLYAAPDAESFDTLRFRDGRVFERYSLPQKIAGEIVGRVWSFRDVTDRERAQAQRELAMEREATIARNLDSALFTVRVGPDGKLLRYDYISGGAEALYGVSAGEMERDPTFWMRRVHPDDLKNVVEPAMAQLLRLKPVMIEVRYETSRGIWRWHRSRLTARIEEDGLLTIDGIETDVTERVHLEERFRHAQKMEAVGQLAGGVAHDFNNILTAVLGYADLLLARLGATDPHRPALEEIKKGGERAAGLTRQLLAFSRRTPTQLISVDVNATIRGVEPMLRRLVGENLEFGLDLADGLGPVRADPVQLEQVIVNLAVNARDAMPEGGSIAIRTDRVVLSEEEASLAEMAEGACVRIRVSDTGSGIAPTVLERIFEPFFTTKEPGRGTGLGLATVYGIVRQHRGNIRATSVEGRGSTFEVLLPESTGAPTTRRAAKPASDALPVGHERVLLVEDNASLLTLARESLTELGYRVFAASNADEALQILEAESGEMDILVTDVVMPEVGGRELARKVERLLPGMPILFVSGYVRDPEPMVDKDGRPVDYLEKPYTPIALARRVRSALDAAPARSAGGAGRAR
ncbi:MAG TPA: PAS domain S-box protein [Candidatus Eisenbacteria bacterium]|nr:PAS domain S-box protein [Candidatus Eisenbacteria bacterium]